MNRSFSFSREHAYNIRSLTILQKTHIGFALVTTLLALLCGTIIWGVSGNTGRKTPTCRASNSSAAR